MQLGKFFKRAFGFNDSETEEAELEGIDARVVPRRIAAQNPEVELTGVHADSRDSGVPDSDSGHCGSTVSAHSADEPSEQPGYSAAPQEIFATVVATFNEALPEFMQQTVDSRKQCDYLYDRLSEDMKTYLSNLEVLVENRCRRRWEEERRSMQQQIDDIREKAGKEEGECAEAKKLQLSAERQKRALSERVHDLEKQLASAEAENEQYLLENKSLVNKLRLTTVTGSSADVDEAVANELSQLGERLKQAEAKQKEAEALARNARESLESVNQELKHVKSDRQEADKAAEELREKLAEAQNQVQNLQTEVGRMQEALEQSRVKDDLGDAMLTDLNSKASQAMKEAEELRRKAAETAQENSRLEHEAEQVRKLARKAEKERQEANTELVSTRRELTVLQSRFSEQQKKLDEASRHLAVVEDITVQVQRLEEAKRINDAAQRDQKQQIADLAEQIEVLKKDNADFSETLSAKDEVIRNLEKTADSLRKTIEANLYEHARTESLLRAEIDRLRNMPNSDAGVAADTAEDYASEPGSAAPAAPEVAPADDFVLTPPAPKRGRRPKEHKPSISAIEDSIENTDWMMAVPATRSRKPVPPRVDADFGYREPERPNHPDNPAQTTLW